MILEMRQKPILTQRLLITPQLQQAIRLLRLSRAELLEEIQHELEVNPALERAEDGSLDQNIQQAIDWHSYLNPYRPPGAQKTTDNPSRETAGFEAWTAAAGSLSEHLLGQLLELSLTAREKQIGAMIVASLDSKGYLQASVEELSALSGAGPQTVKQVLSLMQSFDPPGVCAADLRQCLLIQVRRLGLQDPLLGDIIRDHLQNVARRDYRAICRSLKAKTEAVAAAVKMIQRLEPIPARRFTDSVTRYIEPDVFVRRLEGKFVIELNDRGIPWLRISPVYRKLLADRRQSDNETARYIIKKMRAARWLIRSIHQRGQTLYRVMEAILELQPDFFTRGPIHLQPMVLRDVAERIGMAESTISRVTTSKYAQTPWGVFSLKYFFNSSISRFHGRPVASVSVQEKIKNIIAGEDSRTPLSDSKIAAILKTSDIDIARRTVAKYREILKIPPSSRRRQAQSC